MQTFREQKRTSSPAVPHPLHLSGEQNSPSRTQLPTGQLVPSQCTPTERILLQMLGELQSQVQHMTEIVTQIPTLLGYSPGNAPLTTCAEDERFPLQDTEDLNNVEMQLENVEFKNKLVSKLSLAGGQTLKKTVWMICGKVFDPQLAVHLNWCGRGDKTPMKKTTKKNKKIVNVIISEDEYLGLVDEVLYWLAQPEVREDPIARALASHSRDILEMSLAEDAHLAEDVRDNLRQLRERLTGREARPICVSGESQPPPKAQTRRKKKQRG
nr:uncharacterized protein LOC111838791 [Paramormyrops kingsleyae]